LLLPHPQAVVDVLADVAIQGNKRCTASRHM
jgi:hypothetical protein